MDYVLILLLLLAAPIFGLLLARLEASDPPRIYIDQDGIIMDPPPPESSRVASATKPQIPFWSDNATWRMIVDKGLLAVLLLIAGLYLKSIFADLTELHKEQRAAVAALAKEMSSFYDDASDATQILWNGTIETRPLALNAIDQNLLKLKTSFGPDRR